MTKVTQEPIHLHVLHTCATHDERWDVFTVEETHTLTGGTKRWTMTRCDGTRMDVYSDDYGVKVRP